jgi:Protein of unknown function (DUF992)
MKVTRRQSRAVLAAILLGLGATMPAGVQAQPAWSQVGVLNCTLAPSVGLIIIAEQRMSCIFNANPPMPSQEYTGVLTTVGIDIGATAGGAFAWAVFSQTIGPAFGGLSGTYVGASGEVTVGVGGGVNVLVGGSARSVALQPFSAQGTAGLNFQLGVSGLELRPNF